jgi:hypothetical protein
MGTVMALKIKTAWWNNECRNFIVYGPTGCGKTSFTLQVLMELYKTTDVTVLEKYFAFTPLDFITILKNLKTRVPAVAWDDAGVWLYYMDYNNPVIKKLAKMMQVIRTRTASVIFTTPNPTLILGKLRNFPQTTTVKILKTKADVENEEDFVKLCTTPLTGRRPFVRQVKRKAQMYRSSLMPDLQKLRVYKGDYDDFSVMLPQHVYEWYQAKRENYVQLLENDIADDLDNQVKRFETILKEQASSAAPFDTKSF